MNHVDLSILGVHNIQYYNDDTGYGMTECGLFIFPGDVANTDKPIDGCNYCTPEETNTTTT